MWSQGDSFNVVQQAKVFHKQKADRTRALGERESRGHALRPTRTRMTMRRGLLRMSGMRRAISAAVLVVLVAIAARAQDESASLKFLVIRDYNGKPVRNASVVMHPVEKNGKQSRGGLQIKTDPDGKANFDGVPYGKLRVQVLAQGFQTFGDDYDVNKPEMEITIRMRRPSGQYSIYEEHPGDKKDQPEQKKQK